MSKKREALIEKYRPLTDDEFDALPKSEQRAVVNAMRWEIVAMQWKVRWRILKGVDLEMIGLWLKLQLMRFLVLADDRADCVIGC